MEKFLAEAVSLLAGQVPHDKEQLLSELETPPDPELGDFAYPCFRLAKILRSAPAKISAELAGKITPAPYFSRVEAHGPYLNFYCDRRLLTAETLSGIFAGKERYGWKDRGFGRTVVIDFSAPNIAKPFGIGHLRSTVIGQALYRIYQALGFRCIGINHLGDWGTQFGKLIVAFLRWGDAQHLEEKPIEHLYDLYVRFHRAAETDTALEEEARAWFLKLENGDPEARRLWLLFRTLSLEEFKRVYTQLGVQFDYYQGESFFNEMLGDTVRLVEEQGLAKVSEGALIVSLDEDGLPPCLLRKQDGATLYATRDLCAAIYRQRMFNFDRMLYVVGADQALHFQQLFAVLKKMGYQWAEKCVHVPFGLIRFKDGKMSTRQGTLIFLEDVLARASELAAGIIAEKNPKLPDKEKVAGQVGIGAVIFADLGNDRVKDIEFEWEKVLDFSGETAPYIQYAHARTCSILRKAPDWDGSYDAALLTCPEEQQLVSTLARFGQAIERAAETYKPSVIARYLIELAKEFNKFYHQCPVLTADSLRRASRLGLVAATRQVLQNGLSMLGIAAPDEM
ncbi:MAG: Arginine--tRNA ligase [Syntrophomonadaceae bacterium]|nr:Arginine--tRNA ligase [Bacillota bacterium]